MPRTLRTLRAFHARYWSNHASDDKDSSYTIGLVHTKRLFAGHAPHARGGNQVNSLMTIIIRLYNLIGWFIPKAVRRSCPARCVLFTPEVEIKWEVWCKLAHSELEVKIKWKVWCKLVHSEPYREMDCFAHNMRLIASCLVSLNFVHA